MYISFSTAQATLTDTTAVTPGSNYNIYYPNTSKRNLLTTRCTFFFFKETKTIKV